MVVGGRPEPGDEHQDISEQLSSRMMYAASYASFYYQA
jgi:hypothetical protein